MNNFALEISGLVKSFQGKRVVNNVDMKVAKGEIVGFLGPNGAGKTTIMSIVTGLLAADEGHIRLLGKDDGARDTKTRLRIGYLQEKPRIYPDMSAREYLNLFANIYGVKNVERRVGEVTDRVGITDAADRALGTFSRGMQQRACLARVMLHNPEFLILDEPTLGLDPVGVADLRDIFRQMHRDGVTLMFSSHQLAEMERICDSIIFLLDGKIVAQGRTDQFLPNFDGDKLLTIELLENTQITLPIIKSLPFVETATEIDNHRISICLQIADSQTERDQRAEFVRALSGRGLTVLSIGAASRTLEDVFLRLMNDRQSSLPY